MKKNMIIYFAVVFIMSCNTQNEETFTYDLPFELSNGKKTATYEQTIEFCQVVADESDLVELNVFGYSSMGYELPLLIVDKDGLCDAKSVRRAGRSVLLVEANIHPGEPDGNDAGMLLIKDFINGKKLELLDNVTLLFLPVLNADGLNRFGPHNRINQNGPEMMGWRTNGQNLNLNRDFLKAESPEMQAWLRMYNQWEPDFFIDCHTTDGADYQYVLTYAMENLGNIDKGLTEWQNDVYLPEIERNMFEVGFPIFPYVSFQRWHDPRSGLVQRVGRPMLSQCYTAMRNCPGLLIETHMLKAYKPRVLSTQKMIELTMSILNKDGENLRNLIDSARQYTSSTAFRNEPLTLTYKKEEVPDTVKFLGIDYEVEKSDLTGGDWFKYKVGEEKTFYLPLFKGNIPEKKVDLPVAYIIPPQWENIIEKMILHGFDFFRIEQNIPLTTEMYSIQNPTWNLSPYEGRMSLRDFDLQSDTCETIFPKGSVVVPLSQPGARLLAFALEPESPDSYLQWGFFNAIFEQKEYAETYVMEKLAREMIDQDPALLDEFKAFVKDNHGIEYNSWAQLNWFYQRTPYWDQQKNVYPIGRIIDPKVLNDLRMLQ